MYLLFAGEHLSKQQLQSNNIIKKLKAKDKESEKLITSLRYILISLNLIYSKALSVCYEINDLRGMHEPDGFCHFTFH